MPLALSQSGNERIRNTIMTTVYVLYKNVYGEIENVGVFSTEEKVKRAIELFSPLEEHGELEWEMYEIDKLEKIFDAVTSGYQFYSLSSSKYTSLLLKDYPVIFSDKYIHRIGIDGFLRDSQDDFVFENETGIQASVKAKSKVEAIEKANKMLAEKRKQNAT